MECSLFTGSRNTCVGRAFHAKTFAELRLEKEFDGKNSSLFWEIPRVVTLIKEEFGTTVVVKEVWKMSSPWTKQQQRKSLGRLVHGLRT